MRSPQEATNTVEMYLRIVYECEEEGLAALRARIGERLGHRPPTVSETVARMVRNGLIILTDTRELRFTEVGRGKAVSIMRKHRVVERFLADVIGLAWDQLHPEASRWQHVISDKVERLIAGRLRPPFRCPHGAPIPGLDALGVTGSTFASDSGLLHETTLLPLPTAAGTPSVVRIERIGEALQGEPCLMRMLERASVLPGAFVTITSEAPEVVILSANGQLNLRDTSARHILVSRVPDSATVASHFTEDLDTTDPGYVISSIR
ncbi:metal-dependent transcriptional regulator [Streptomyces tendae]|uniref:metal-dependent transcriptional regulator n=1 Tax=Streptomyces tendae TaxID=1932 RepID=UPI003797D003